MKSILTLCFLIFLLPRQASSAPSERFRTDINPGPNHPAQIDVERRVGDSRYTFYRVALSRSSEEFDFLLAHENPTPTHLGEPHYQLRSAWRNLDL